jgi:2-phosphoglycerate kinase
MYPIERRLIRTASNQLCNDNKKRLCYKGVWQATSQSLCFSPEDGMRYPRVILIGGAPMAGKTTVAHLLAAHLGYGCLSTDDLGEAIRAVATKDSHPALHPMAGYDYREYHVTHSPEALIADVRREHQAMWPAVQRVIRTHATWGEPIIMEGWSLWPEWVTQLRLPSVQALWFVAQEETLHARLVQAVAFYRGASDEAAMRRQYLARSVWYNTRLQEAVHTFGLTSFALPLRAPAQAIVARCLEQLGR